MRLKGDNLPNELGRYVQRGTLCAVMKLPDDSPVCRGPFMVWHRGARVFWCYRAVIRVSLEAFGRDVEWTDEP